MGRAAASDGWGLWGLRGPGCERVSATDEGCSGEAGAWQPPWCGEVEREVLWVVDAAGVSGLQFCCWGLLGGGCVGAVQWLWVSTGAGLCDGVSLDDCSVPLLWLSEDSWTTLSARYCPSAAGCEASQSLLMMSVVRIS